MDSGNSTGSTQSSSAGGDEESYDSRAESSSISAFLNNNNNPPQTHVGPFTTPPTTTINSSSSANHNLLPINTPHPYVIRPSFITLFGSNSKNNNPITSPLSLLNLDMAWSTAVRSEPNQPDLDRLIGLGVAPFPTGTPPPPPPQQAHTTNSTARNPKKRSRASRHAPTTFLTTDTSNFRAMVQEFTGIPAQPFTPSSFPRKARLDLFGSSLPAAAPPHLLRPFAQKVPAPLIPQPTNSSPLIPAVNSSSLLLPNSYIQINNVSNSSPIFNFQAPQPRHPQASLEIPSQSTINSVDFKMGGVLEELGLMSHAQVGGLQDLVQSSPSRVINNHNNVSYSSGSIQDQERVVSNGKVNNYAASSSDFHHGAAARSEGMVESWINCSSH